ncbi:MAG: hypothetical protein FVQ81_14780 [Candidatus Glassbacteria bacterium]|nr:hypothetical protein [Candidatus Glassbacteria bacterium]
MGHMRLGVLSTSRKWIQVVDELRLGVDVGTVAASAAEAAEASLQAASNDPAFLHAFWLLTQVPLAARGPDFADNLRRLGVQAPNQPSLMDVVAAISGAVDHYAREQGGRTDLGEMAQMAAIESLTTLVGPDLPSLFEPNAGEVQRAIGRFAGGDRFSALAREFFSRLTQRSLDYYLSRELGKHIGPGERFRDDAARAQFDDALDRHCWEASRIVETFAGGWYGKNVYQGDGLTPDAIRKFAPVAFKKIRAELQRRRDAEE